MSTSIVVNLVYFLRLKTRESGCTGNLSLLPKINEREKREKNQFVKGTSPMQMALNQTEGAGLGAVFDELFQAVFDIYENLTTFSSTLKSLKSTLISVKPILDLEKLNKALDRPQQETDMFIHRLREGEKLVHKCSKIKSWDLYKKYSYSKKISELEDSIIRFFQVDVQAHLVRDTKEILVGLYDVDKKVDKVLSILKKTA